MKNFRGAIIIIVQVLCICAICISAIVPVSCKLSAEGIDVLAGDFYSPVINKTEVLDAKTFRIYFSEEVQIEAFVLSPFIEEISNSSEHSDTHELSTALNAANGAYGKISGEVLYLDNNKTVDFKFLSPMDAGKSYEVYGLVNDRHGNSLTFCIPFKGFNDKIPKLIISEAQVKYAKATVSGETVYRSEFIEILCLSSGNLAGINVYSAIDSKEKLFEFPPINVQAGEVIIVHPRSAGENCINEDKDIMDLSKAPFSSDSVRDLWSSNTGARYNDTCDLIILENSYNNSILDMLFYSTDSDLELKPPVQDMLNKAKNENFLSVSHTEEAFNAKGISPLKSITRKNSLELLENVRNNEDFIYPVRWNNEDWEVLKVSPGIIS